MRLEPAVAQPEMIMAGPRVGSRSRGPALAFLGGKQSIRLGLQAKPEGAGAAVAVGRILFALGQRLQRVQHRGDVLRHRRMDRQRIPQRGIGDTACIAVR